MEPWDIAEIIVTTIRGALRRWTDVWKYTDGGVDIVVPVDDEVRYEDLKRLEERLSRKLKWFEISVTSTAVRGWSRLGEHLPSVVVRYWPSKPTTSPDRVDGGGEKCGS